MTNLRKLSVIILFIFSLTVGSFTVYSINRVQSYGTLINYLGIIRGATQRLVKLELYGHPNNDLIEYLDNIMLELVSGEGKYGLIVLRDPTYHKDLKSLSTNWNKLKSDIYNVRKDLNTKPILLKNSESYFFLANTTVFVANDYATKRTNTLLLLSCAMFTVLIAMWIFLFISYRKKLFNLTISNKHLYEKTTRDKLTGVFNIEVFKEKAQYILDTTQNKYSITYVDFADFKYINDVFGYNYGDAILINYAQAIQTDLRQQELVGRVSADNFVILRYYDTKDQLLERQQALDANIAQFMLSLDGAPSVPVQCGICFLEDTSEHLHIDDLLNRANYARKIVKSGCTLKYAIYNENIRNQLRDEKNMESRLQTALKNNEFIIYYQPKVELATGKALHAEALVRWKMPNGTIISPNKFIPLLEKKFLIDELDQYVFEKVCQWLQQRLKQQQTVGTISVNVSRLQFYNAAFVQRYTDIKNHYSIPDGLLEIEITESIAFDNISLLRKNIVKLKENGFLISIDDFGSGFSSLSLLKNIPIDILKIDQSFFANDSQQQKDRIIVKGIIDLVKQLHIKTVAEGIENTEQVEFLKSINCDMIQGFVFYKPMPAEDFETILDEHSQ